MKLPAAALGTLSLLAPAAAAAGPSKPQAPGGDRAAAERAAWIEIAEEFEVRIAEVAELQDRAAAPALLLYALATTVPDDVWLTEVRRRGQRVTIEGLAPDTARAAAFVAALDAVPALDDVALRGTEPARAWPSQRKTLTRFEVTAVQLLEANRHVPPPPEVGEMTGSSLAEWEARTQHLAEVLAAGSRMLPTGPERDDALRRTRAVGRKLGLTFLEIRERPEASSGFYAEVPHALAVEGSFHEVGVFLDRLARLNRVVHLGDFVLRWPAEPRRGPVVVHLDGTLVTYRMFVEGDPAGDRSRAKPWARAPEGGAGAAFGYVWADDLRDPFRPPVPSRKEDPDAAPLQRWSIDLYDLIAVDVVDGAPAALIGDLDGGVHTVRAGTPLGKAGGKVTSLTPTDLAAGVPGSILVVEEYRDPIENELIINEITMRVWAPPRH